VGERGHCDQEHKRRESHDVVSETKMPELL